MAMMMGKMMIRVEMGIEVEGKDRAVRQGLIMVDLRAPVLKDQGQVALKGVGVGFNVNLSCDFLKELYLYACTHRKDHVKLANIAQEE